MGGKWKPGQRARGWKPGRFTKKNGRPKPPMQVYRRVRSLDDADYVGDADEPVGDPVEEDASPGPGMA